MKTEVDVHKYERLYHSFGYNNVAGVDDVGRGCFAGPVVCAAVIFSDDTHINGLVDSKLIPKHKHEEYYNKVISSCVDYGIGFVSSDIIERINIKKASQLAMKKAIESLSVPPDFILIDGNEIIDLNIPQISIIKGDQLSHSISAASVVAKFVRDNFMKDLDAQYDFKYGWSNNAGYPTPSHIEAVKKYGITPYHRRTWGSMKKI